MILAGSREAVKADQTNDACHTTVTLTTNANRPNPALDSTA
jgi:hypothetical protein